MNTISRFCLYLFCSFVLGSCITTSSLIKKNNDRQPNISAAHIQGTFCNKADSLGISLWTALYDSYSFKYDTAKYPERAVVRLSLSGNKLRAELRDGNKVLKHLELKVRVHQDYVSVKRHLLLVPIPFAFFNYHEVRNVLYMREDATLRLSYAESHFVWILLAAGKDDYGNTSYRRIPE